MGYHFECSTVGDRPAPSIGFGCVVDIYKDGVLIASGWGLFEDEARNRAMNILNVENHPKHLE